MGWDEREGFATNFPEVGERGGSSKPEFRRGFPSDGDRTGDIGKEGGSSVEFIPEGCGGVARKAHCTGFAVEGAMEAFGAPVLGRGVRGSELVVDAALGAPVLHGLGKQFAIVGDKDLKTSFQVVFHFELPLLEGLRRVTLFL